MIFWINAAYFSKSDATPVSFKGYSRGRLVGDSSGGAGGTVEAFPTTGLRDINDKYTSSLMVEAGYTTSQMLATGIGRVEQVGAPVDQRIMPTTNDIITGGADLFSKLNRYAIDYFRSP